MTPAAPHSSAASPTLTVDDAIWTLDLGDDENRFTPEWVDQAQRALDQVEASTDPAVLLTVGSGRFYSNGLDLDRFAERPDELVPYVRSVESLLARVLALPVPTVAAVNGHAFGAGAMLALAHDVRVMRRDRGYFCFPEVDIGIPFSAGMNALILAKLTPQAAVESMTTGRRYGGPAAQELGLVQACADEADVVATATTLVEGLAGKDRTALGSIKAGIFADALDALRGSS